MPEFHLDTSGVVKVRPTAMPEPWKPGHWLWAWRDLDAFTHGYIEALFFTENEPGTTRQDRMTTRGTVRKSWADREREGQQKDMPGDYGFADLAPDALASILKDCVAFQTTAIAGLDKTGAAIVRDDLEHAGRDFWYTRNGHGCGFWDGDWPEPYGDALTRAAKAFGEVYVYVGDDGKVWL